MKKTLQEEVSRIREMMDVSEDIVTNGDRIEMLSEAASKLSEVIQLCKMALKGTEYEDMAKSYLIDHLDLCRDSSNWASNDDGIIQYIEKLENSDEDDYDDDDE
jgi:hypothetical protein